MKTLLIIILFIVSIKGLAQEIPNNIKDTIFVVFDYKKVANLGMSRSYDLNKKEVFSVWNKEKDSIIFIGKDNVQFHKRYLKKAIPISKLITMGIFNYLKLVENKIIFMIDDKDISRKVMLVKIDEAIFKARPQECF